MRRQAYLIILILMAALLAGCTMPFVSPSGYQTAGPGQAAYTYRNGECEVIITSARDPKAGTVKISKDCDVEVEAELSPSAQLQLANLNMTQALIEQLSVMLERLINR